MVSEKRLDVTKLEELNVKELKDVAHEIGITKISKKSNIVLLEEIKSVARVFIAGQGDIKAKYNMYLLKFILFIGPCHTYIQQRGKTAGFQDCHCPHRFKICTKMQAAQETVSDPSNIIHSM